jgi:hypothetical protein
MSRAMEEEENEIEKAKFTFFMPRDPEATYVAAQVRYRDVHLMFRIEDTDDCADDLNALLKYVPEIAKKCREERAIRREAEGLDQELSDLFGDDE